MDVCIVCEETHLWDMPRNKSCIFLMFAYQRFIFRSSKRRSRQVAWNYGRNYGRNLRTLIGQTNKWFIWLLVERYQVTDYVFKLQIDDKHSRISHKKSIGVLPLELSIYQISIVSTAKQSGPAAVRESNPGLLAPEARIKHWTRPTGRRLWCLLLTLIDKFCM